MKFSPRLYLLIWLVTGYCAGSPTPCYADTDVTLRPSFEIDHATVRLSDLFDGVPTVIDRDIAQAPLPGKEADYDNKLLAKLADKYRLNWRPVTQADHILITAACTRLTTDMLKEAVISKAKDNGARGEVDVAFDIHNLEIDLPANTPGDFTLANFDYDIVSKRFHTDVTAQTKQGPVIVPIAGRVAIRFHVPVLAHRLDSGTIISSNDLDWASVPEERVNDSVITDAHQLIGHETRHAITEGELFRVNDVVPPRLVTRGNMVTMHIENAFMTISAQGRALQDGTMGDTVRVMNLQSNRVIEGVVDSTGTVIVLATRKLASAE